MTGFTDKYPFLFYSLVLLCFGYGAFLVFYVNDKIREINKISKIKKRAGSIHKVSLESESNLKKTRLITHSKMIMLIMLGIVLFINTIFIFSHGYNDIPGLVGAYAFPIIAFFVFVFFLLIAIGLKGASVLRTGRFFKGLDY